MKTKVLAGFPGVGKSHFFREVNRDIFPKVSDSDSSNFSWITNAEGEKVRNPEFPENYVNHIKSLIADGYDIVMVSTHKEVLDALYEAGIEFEIVVPVRTLKAYYIGRYELRKSPQTFINLLDSKWEDFMDDIDSHPAPKVYLTNPNSYMSHVIEI